MAREPILLINYLNNLLNKYNMKIKKWFKSSVLIKYYVK
jgi:hypothetical protein